MLLWNKIFSYIELAGSIQGVFLAIVLFRLKTKEGKAHCILALLVLVVTYLLFWAALHDSRLLIYAPDLFPTGPAVTFLIGPLLFFYVKTMTRLDLSWKNSYLLHLTPFIVFLAFQFPFWLKGYAEKKAFLIHHYQVHHLMAPVSQIPNVIILLYLIPIIRMLNHYEKRMNQYFSNTDQLKLKWLRNFMYGFGLIWTVFIITYLFSGIHLSGNIICVLLALAIYLISYKSMRSPVLFGFLSLENKDISHPESHGKHSKDKYAKSGLKTKDIPGYLKQLSDLMEKEHLYRNQDLTLKDLAEKLSISSHQLSQLLNQHLEISFYDYINQYRIEGVKKALKDPENKNYTILTLAFEGGFRSKATFQTVFKKWTGSTPTEYMKENTQ